MFVSPRRSSLTEYEQRSPAEIEAEIVERIYKVALDPAALEDFISFWDGLHEGPSHPVRQTRAVGSDPTFVRHVERAEEFLRISQVEATSLDEKLENYRALSAFCVDDQLVVRVANASATSVFQVTVGTGLSKAALPEDLKGGLERSVFDVLHRGHSERLLRADLPQRMGSLVLKVSGIRDPASGQDYALVVANKHLWNDRTGSLLGDLYGLTKSEIDVVRKLLDGLETKEISEARETSEGTVRLQVKSILEKLNVRSKTAAVRLVMALATFPDLAAAKPDENSVASPALTNDWLEHEVWKPLASVRLRDGRKLTYLDMGPYDGRPIVMSHMGSCMVRWSKPMLRLAYAEKLRVICPVRAGYGHSDPNPTAPDPINGASKDTAELLAYLGIVRVPYAAQGTDFAFAADLASTHPKLVSEIVGIGARPCMPGGGEMEAPGRWQRFFVSAAQRAPHLVRFASRGVMAMSRQLGPEAMLRQLCKDSPADVALLEDPETLAVLTSNLSLMSGKLTDAAGAFAEEFIALQRDTSAQVATLSDIRISVFLATEDHTFDFRALPILRATYPWISFERMEGAGLALMYQRYEDLIPKLASAARRALL